jgi:hypothetical protein
MPYEWPFALWVISLHLCGSVPLKWLHSIRVTSSHRNIFALTECLSANGVKSCHLIDLLPPKWSCAAAHIPIPQSDAATPSELSQVAEGKLLEWVLSAVNKINKKFPLKNDFYPFSCASFPCWNVSAYLSYK